jgi:RNA polymerase sigma-70 factor (ECF subfamily)
MGMLVGSHPLSIDARETPSGSGAVRSVRLEFEAVYDEHAPFVWRTLRRLGVADAALDDVFQEIFLVVHRRLAEFEGRSSLRTWLFGVALHVVRRHRRTTHRKARHLESDAELDAVPDSARTGPLEQAAKTEAVRVLRALLDELDDEKREVFVMIELEQMPAAEIAEVLGINVNTVHSRLRAARQAFEQALARHHARDRWRLR